MNRTLLAILVATATATTLAAVGCSSSDSGSSGSSGGTDAATDTNNNTDTGVQTDSGADAGPPAPPTLGAQIDRMGRPAINTALNHAFDANAATKDPAKDAYNKALPATWDSFVPEMEANLAILDSLDSTCGNQAFADTTKTDKTRYGTLAGVLANDRLWVNTGSTTCTTYLAVEVNATNVFANTDCGGRKPSYEVMKGTYAVVATGSLTVPVTDGTTQLAKSQVATFPYLAPTQ